jgi:EpsI family protein
MMWIRRTLLFSGLLVVATIGVVRSSRTEEQLSGRPLSTFPTELGAWKSGETIPLDPEVMSVLGVDDYLNRVYQKAPGLSASLYVGSFRSQRTGRTIHSPMVCLPGGGWVPAESGRLSLLLDSGRSGPAVPGGENGRLRRVEVSRLLVENAGQRQLVLYWYQSRDRVIAGDYWAKVYKFIDAVRLNRTDGALVRVMVPIPDSPPMSEAQTEAEAVAFVQAVFPVLCDYLPR